jgi:hypothetical protein
MHTLGSYVVFWASKVALALDHAIIFAAAQHATNNLGFVPTLLVVKLNAHP